MPFEHKIIDLKQKPADFLRLSPTGLVPLLELDDGTVVSESVVVARHIAVTFDQHAQLLPPSDQPLVDDFVKFWSSRVEPAYYEILKASSEAQVQIAVDAFRRVLVQVDERLRSGWDGEPPSDAATPFLLGERFSLAEAVAAPWVERMLLMLPYWRKIDAVELCEESGCARTAAWLRAVATRPSVEETSAGEAEMARAAKLYYVDYATPGCRGESAL